MTIKPFDKFQEALLFPANTLIFAPQNLKFICLIYSHRSLLVKDIRIK